MKRTREQLLESLSQQLQFINASCDAFDAGNENESLRTLPYDTQISKSLLSQLGSKEVIKFIDSADPIDPVPTNKRDGASLVAPLSVRQIAWELLRSLELVDITD